MSSVPVIQMTGDHAVIAKLRDLTKQVQKRLIDRAGRAALKDAVKTARSGVPRDTGNLAKSIGVKKAKKFKGGVLLMVGPRPGFKWARAYANGENDPMRYGIPVEFGHTLPNGTFVPPAGFLRNAYNLHRVQIVTDFGIELDKRITAYLARGA